mgnify:FL=1|jgi:hypothetical protein
MKDLLQGFSTEELLLVQGVLSELNKQVMTNPILQVYWNLRAFKPNEPIVIKIKDFVATMMDYQVEIGVMLASAGVNKDIMIEAPISKTVFNLMSQSKKDTIFSLMKRFEAKFEDDPNKFTVTTAIVNIWNNMLVR